jgi:hypothetical protein
MKTYLHSDLTSRAQIGCSLGLAVLVHLALPNMAQAQYTYTTNVDNTITITGYTTNPVGAVEIPFSINGKTVTGIWDEAFRNCTTLTSVTIPGGVTSIGGRAFENCINMTSVTIPVSVTNLKCCVFAGCASLTSAVIPPGITRVEDYMFDLCGSLTNVTILGNVTNLANHSFYGCGNLTRVYFWGNAPSLANSEVFPYTPCTIYRREETSGWPPVPDLWAGRPTALWQPNTDGIIIESIKANGSLSFSGAQIGTIATIEWAASLIDPGRTNWHVLSSFVVVGDNVTCDIPMYYRVRGTPYPRTSVTNARFFASGNNYHDIRHNGNTLTTADRTSLHVAITNINIGDLITVHLNDRFDIMSLWMLAQTGTGINLFEVSTNWTGYLPVSTSVWWDVTGAIITPALICPTNREYTDLVRTQASYTPNYFGSAPTIYSPLAGSWGGGYGNAFLFHAITAKDLNP